MDYKSIKRPISILLLVLAISLPATVLADNPTREWTFMLFMAADNNLESGTSLDINELERYGSTDEVAFVAQVDRNGNFSHNSELTWSGTRRFYVTRDKDPNKMSSKMVQDLGEVDMATPQALTDFVEWARNNYPARKYALILWNHGTGWKEIQPSIMEYEGSEIAPSQTFNPDFDMSNIAYNISYDDTSHSSMDIPSMRETLAKVKEILGQPIDLLGFDACLMQMVEVGWAAAPFARYQVGSPDLEPERGWPYDLISKALTKKPEMSAMDLGKTIVRAYKASYDSGSQGNTAVVLSLFDLEKMSKFRQKLNNFCFALRENITDIDKIEKCRRNALKYSYGDYIDLAHFLHLMRKTSVSSETKATAYELYKAIIGEKRKGGLVAYLGKTGDKFRASRGVSVFFPDRQGFKTYMNRYKRLSFSRETEWFAALREVAIPNIPYMKIIGTVLADKNQDGRIAAGEEVTLNLKVQNLGRKGLKEAQISCRTDSDYLDNKNYKKTVKKLPGPQETTLVPVFTFKVNENTPVHSEIKLEITLRGKDIPISTTKTTFYVKEPFASTGHALLVMTDAFSPAGPVLTEMLNGAQVKFDTWDRVLDGDLRSEVLKRYLDGWVIVVVQDSTPQQSLTETEIEALDHFLNSGGKLVLSGQDIAFSLRDSNFLRKKCKASFIQDDVNIHVISGLNGFAGEETMQIFGGDGANNQKWPDEIDALPGATPIIKYREGARDMADESQMAGPNHKPNSNSKGIKSSGTAAVKVVDGYRLLLITFGFEAINNSSQRNAFMKAIMKAMHPDIAAELRNYAEAAVRRPATRSISAEEYIQRADLLSNVEKKLLEKIRTKLDADPEYGREMLMQIRRLPAQEQRAVENLEKNIKSLLEFDKQHGTLNQR